MRRIALLIPILLVGCTLSLDPGDEDCFYDYASIAADDSLSDRCREEIVDQLPEASTQFTARIDVLGEALDGDRRRLFFVGADADGQAMNFVDTVLEVGADGEDLVEGEDYERCEVGGSDVSLTFVNDYSRSMTTEETSGISSIERRLTQELPSGYEGQVVYYDDDVELVQAATDDDSLIGAALSPDLDYGGGSTAFYDGFGTGLDRLRARTQPLRILVVNVNGPDNASSIYDRSTVVVTTGEEEVFVVTLATFAADPDELEDVQGDRALLFYGPDAAALDESVTPFLDAVGSMGCVELSEDHVGAGEISLTAAGQTTVWEPE